MMLNDERMTDERRQAIEKLVALIDKYGVHAIKAALRELVRQGRGGKV